MCTDEIFPPFNDVVFDDVARNASPRARERALRAIRADRALQERDFKQQRHGKLGDGEARWRAADLPLPDVAEAREAMKVLQAYYDEIAKQRGALP